MMEFVALRPLINKYLTDDGHVDKRAKNTNKCVTKGEIKFEVYKTCLEKNRKILRAQQRFRSEAHNVFTVKVNKIFLSVNIIR